MQMYNGIYHNIEVSDWVYPKIQEVVFDKFICDTSVNVGVHWTRVFEFADKDDCGGLGLKWIRWEDGTKTFASGRYRGGKLVAICIGAYGDIEIRRVEK